ncbi:ogr/Delta-like zinc finger family protein [Escherichia coli]|uniref:ogr/Delta-like zinc finger family protein n=1 Tax=Escherichia coli TaxID=562 RepID=UPI0028788D6D|nr:ogr/Delta-like zinc finger family protein [Escherichia coli]MDS1619948.1 ogr/Delta-like zinc finger family protein [Escherichia coli]
MASFPCPICGASSCPRTSTPVTHNTRLAYFRCNNLLCGTTYAVTLSFSHVVSRGVPNPDLHKYPPIPRDNLPAAHQGRDQLDLGF